MANNLLTQPNGNGDEMFSTYPERYQAWSHLAKSGMIVGDYNGVGNLASDQNPGVNLPESGAVKSMIYLIDYNPDVYDIRGIYMQLLDFISPAFDGKTKSSDIYYIDKKIDDGDNGISSATTGKIYALRSASLVADNTKCVTQYFNAASADYILTDDTESCRILLWLDKR